MNGSSRRFSRPYLFGAFIVMLAAVAAALSSTTVQKAAITTENGVHVVRNPASPVTGPAGRPMIVDLVQDMVIGNDTAVEDHWFAFLNGLDVDAAGNILTLDPKTVRIRIFGPDGRLIKAFGAKGQGPGELQGPGGITALPNGTISIGDVLNRRFSYFSRDGRPLKDLPFGQNQLGHTTVDGRSDIIADRITRSDRIVHELMKFGPDLKPLARIHSFSVNFAIRHLNLFSDNFLFAAVGRDRLAWMVSTHYELEVIDASGAPVMKITVARPPRKMTDKDKEIITRKNFPEGGPAAFTLDFPDVYPAASTLLADEKGRIFVRTYDVNEAGDTAVDVFDAGGLYIARFFLSEDLTMAAAAKDRLYCYGNDPESGNPVVRRFILKWR